MITGLLRNALLVGVWVGSTGTFAKPLIPLISKDLKHDLSPAVRDLARQGISQPFGPGPILEIPEPEREQDEANGPQIDSAEQTFQGEPLALSMGLAFDGLGDGVYGFTVRAVPPDTVGAVGATQFVQWVNTSFAVFDKSTGALLAGPTLGNALWQDFGGPCETRNNGDPVVVYDKLADRWVLSQLQVREQPFLQCVAVSTTHDATGDFFRYAFEIRTFPDYGKMGVWPDAYYMGFNSGPNPVCAFERAAMLNGDDARQVCFEPNQGFMLPTDFDGLTLPPDGTPNFFMRAGRDNQTVILNRFFVDFSDPPSSHFDGPPALPVAPFTRLSGGVPQPGTANTLDTLSGFLMFRLAYRNFGDHESLVLNHSVRGSGGTGGVRWYEIQDPNGKPTVNQQSTFVPDSSYRWMGSIAMDSAGNIALGYSLSDADSTYPSIGIAGRQSTDPPSVLGAEIVPFNGTGSQTNVRRWGDYSAMTVDPIDDCTFWYTGEYHKTTGSPWSTGIVSFKFDNCGT